VAYSCWLASLAIPLRRTPPPPPLPQPDTGLGWIGPLVLEYRTGPARRILDEHSTRGAIVQWARARLCASRN